MADSPRSPGYVDPRRLAGVMGFFFLVVCALGMLRPIKNSLALDGLGATDFYKVYLVSAAAVLVVPPYTRLADRYSQRWLIPGVAFFFALNLLLFRAFYGEGSAAYGMLFYGWYDLFGAALVTQFFIATQQFFDARSAKRAYPLIVAGGAVGATVGGALTGVLAQTLGTPNLLLIAAALIVVFGAGLPWVWAAEPTVTMRAGVRRVERFTAAGFRAVFGNPQVRLIAAGVLLTVVVKQLVDYQFNVVSKQVFETRDAVAAFQGTFNAATQWLPIVVVLALRPLMKRWGVGLAVLLLPAFMLVTTFGIAVWLGLASVVAAKAAETSLRYSAERTGREVLYVPIPEQIKLKAKAYIDVAVEKGLGKLVAAGLIWALLGVAGPAGVAWAAFVLSALWVVAALGIRREYVRSLAASIQGRVASLRGLSASLSDAGTLPALRRALTGGDRLQTAFALDLIDQAEPAEVGPFAGELHGLLDDPAAEVRERALRSLTRFPAAIEPARIRPRLDDAVAAVREAAVRAMCLARPAEREALLVELLGSSATPVRTAVLACLMRGDFGGNGAASVGHGYLQARAVAAIDGAPEARREVALSVGVFRPGPDVDRLLHQLLDDAEPDVASAALRGAALLHDAALYPRMVAALAAPRTREAARDALALQGSAALPALAGALLDPDAPPAVRRAVPGVLARIPVQESVELLIHALLARETDQLLDFRALKALSQLRARHPELHFDAREVNRMLTREIDCARRYAGVRRLLAGHARAGRRTALLRAALHEAWLERREGVFRGLGLLHDPAGMYRCYLAVTSGRAGSRANALEWLEQTVGYRRFAALAAVLEEGSGARPAPPPLEPLLVQLRADEDHWVARCAAAATAELAIAPELAVGFPASASVRASPSTPAPGAADMDPIEKVFLLQGIDLLQDARSAHLALLASIAEEVEASPGALLLERDTPADALYVVVDGAVDLEGFDGQALVATNGTGFGTWALIDEAPSLVSARASRPTRLLRIARADFFDLLCDHPELSVGLLQGLARRVRTLIS